MRILSEYDVNIDNNNIDDFNIFILKIQWKEDEIKYCIGKTDKEIKALNEPLQNIQSEGGNLQPEDFDEFIVSKKYVNEIIESQVSNDK